MDENELQEIQALFDAALDEKQVEIDHLRAALEREQTAANVLLTKLAAWGYRSAGQTLPSEIGQAIFEFEMERRSESLERLVDEVARLRDEVARLKDALRNVATGGQPGVGLDSSGCSESRTLYVE
jgi:septal ring factor EnvC (AmiA/AmiB activator)